MGRETTCECRIRGGTAGATLEEGPVKALLEPTEVILRGAIKRRYAIAAIGALEVRGEALQFRCDGEQVALLLGEKEAPKWLAKLSVPPPTLAAKLGVSAATPAFVVGPLDDPALAEALQGARTRSATNASVLVAVMRSEAELERAVAAHAKLACPMLWAVYPKGAASPLKDATVRRTLRAAGYMDNKTTAVSAELTATRYKRG